jgi:N-acetylmuramoyl-L-alanine amidase
MLAVLWMLSLVLVCVATAWYAAKQPLPAPKYGMTLDPLTTPPQRYDWTRLPEPAFPVPPYATHLRGVKIVLDPGHGARKRTDPRSRVGVAGVYEEDVNLRVTLLLREFLQAAGADVKLTRDADVYLAEEVGDDLRLRAQLATTVRADLLLSIHHNATDDPRVNRTEVYYHNDPDYSPASLDVARHLATALGDALHLTDHLPCPLVTDLVQAPRSGFLLLREAQVPAVLVEASYFTDPVEELRLHDPVYDRREAYALFLGLARWAYGGLPHATLGTPNVPRGAAATVTLDDGINGRPRTHGFPLISAESVVVRLDDRPIWPQVDVLKRQVTFTVPPDLPSGTHTLYVNFANVWGQHVGRPNLRLTVP